MPALARRFKKIFAKDSANNGVFGSAAALAPATSTNPETIESLAAFLTGWEDATEGGLRLPTLEDMQGLKYDTDYHLAYIYENGMQVYNSLTTYYTNNLVREDATGKIWKSLTDNNLGNALVAGADWALLGDISTAIPATTTTKGSSFLPSPITIANNATDANNDIDFSAGNFTVFDGSAQGVSSAETKRLDATWAVGNNAGGLAAGLTKAINTTYHCFKLYNPTTGATDSGFDTSFSAANLLADSAVIAAGFTKYAWRMAITTGGSGGIRSFFQDGKTIQGGVLVYNSTTVPAAYTDLVLSNIPVGLRVKVTLDVYISDNTANSIDFLDKVTGYAYTSNTIVANTADRAKLSIFTDTSATVQHRGSATPATAYTITTQYWEIPDNLY